MFYAQNGQKRPKRLSEATRKFAYDSLGRKYGRDTLQTPAVPLDDIEDLASLSDLEKYDRAIQKIAAEAPIRLCKDEKISGAATLGLAIQHFVPATYRGQTVCPSISHLTVDFASVLKYGVNAIKQKAEKAYQKYKHSARTSR